MALELSSAEELAIGGVECQDRYTPMLQHGLLRVGQKSEPSHYEPQGCLLQLLWVLSRDSRPHLGAEHGYRFREGVGYMRLEVWRHLQRHTTVSLPTGKGWLAVDLLSVLPIEDMVHATQGSGTETSVPGRLAPLRAIGSVGRSVSARTLCRPKFEFEQKSRLYPIPERVQPIMLLASRLPVFVIFPTTTWVAISVPHSALCPDDAYPTLATVPRPSQGGCVTTGRHLVRCSRVCMQMLASIFIVFD
jgi:hypothetical protein